MRQPGGIRSKITFWFYLLLAFMIVSSGITYWIVSVVEEKHFTIEKADVFLEDILEVRLMEKNFLLYRDKESMERWLEYLDAVSRQLVTNNELFVRLSSFAEITEIQHALDAYKATFVQFQDPEADGDLIAEKIREQGSRLTTLTEELIVQEHRTIHRLLALIRNSLLGGLPVFVLFFSAVAVLLGRGIVSSLRQLERHAAKIAAGNFVELSNVGSNKEINNLVNAFNRMSRELRIRQQQLVRSEKLASLGTMLAGVAHEFNNPLSNISSSAQILAEELDPNDDVFALELVAQISAEANRAATIVHTLLSLAREEKFQRNHYLLKPLLQEILYLLRGQSLKNIEIQLAVSDEIEIFADKQKIQQVFINLLRNGIDALDGQGVITIRAWKNHGDVKIAISDNGPGIPQKMQEKIFDPFFTTKDTGQGSGLGLFIVHDIIVQHGGRITVDSAGKGAVFTIILPAGEIS